MCLQYSQANRSKSMLWYYNGKVDQFGIVPLSLKAWDDDEMLRELTPQCRFRSRVGIRCR